jgi:hypothetical protein
MDMETKCLPNISRDFSMVLSKKKNSYTWHWSLSLWTNNILELYGKKKGSNIN